MLLGNSSQRKDSLQFVVMLSPLIVQFRDTTDAQNSIPRDFSRSIVEPGAKASGSFTMWPLIILKLKKSSRRCIKARGSLPLFFPCVFLPPYPFSISISKFELCQPTLVVFTFIITIS